MSEAGTPIAIGLHAAVVAVDQDKPLVLTVRGNGSDTALPALPFGPFDPTRHRTLEAGLRKWVVEQTRLSLGYVEQLYTFGDRGRLHAPADDPVHFVSVGYLALVQKPGQTTGETPLLWNSWYQYFPWEDWRNGTPPILENLIFPGVRDWIEQSDTADIAAERRSRARLAFGADAGPAKSFEVDSWDEERVLERYELMYEAGLVDEAVTDGWLETPRVSPTPGQPMLHDHRRILATAIARLRAKLKYRPVVFELLPETFTLTELQRTVETLSGQLVHKQNFRRLVEKAGLVEPTGARSSETGGRPAAYFRFKRSITRERPAPGLKVRS